jgi:hypothetical protein
MYFKNFKNINKEYRYIAIFSIIMSLQMFFIDSKTFPNTQFEGDQSGYFIAANSFYSNFSVHNIRPIGYHVFYLGLLMAISLVFAKKIFIESLKLGIGWLVVVILFYLFAIQNESRILLNLIIFIAIPVLQWINKSGGINKIKLIIFLAISLLVSRFFLKLNHTPDMWKLMENPNEFLKFPVQRYFMNFGPWVSYDMYYLEAGIFILLIIVSLYLFKSATLSKE